MLTPAAALSLSEGQKSAIESLLRNGATPQKMALRGRPILLAEQGLANRVIAEQFHVCRPTVLAMRTAFVRNGLEAITGVRKRKRQAASQGLDRRIGGSSVRDFCLYFNLY